MISRKYTNQTKILLGASLLLILSGCNMENGVHKTLDFLYGESNSKTLEEMQVEYEQSHNFEAVPKGNSINGDNFIYVRSLLKNPKPNKNDKEAIAKTMVSYLEVKGDEFDRNAKLNVLTNDVSSAFNDAATLIKSENFSVKKSSLFVQLGEYDFERKGFPIRNKSVNYEVKISPQFSSAAIDNSRILVSGERFTGKNVTKRMRAAVIFDIGDIIIPVAQSNARDFKQRFSQQGSFITLYAKAESTSQMSLSNSNPLDNLASPIPGSAGIRLGSGNMPAIKMSVYRMELFKMENKTAIRIGGTSDAKS